MYAKLANDELFYLCYKNFTGMLGSRQTVSQAQDLAVLIYYKIFWYLSFALAVIFIFNCIIKINSFCIEQNFFILLVKYLLIISMYVEFHL